MHAERLSALAQTTQAAKPITGSTRARVRGFVRAALTDRVLARFRREPQTQVGPAQPRPPAPATGRTASLDLRHPLG